MTYPPFDKASSLDGIEGVRHGFFGRRGSDATNETDLNTSETIGDDPDQVAHNRHLALTTIGLGAMPLASLRQTHSVIVETLSFAPKPDARPEADGLATALTGVALGILTADCAPILFADTKTRVIGACHAGWQGAVDGIIANTIAAMRALGATPNNIVAAIGPTISGADYEVGPERAAQVIAANQRAKAHVFIPDGGAREHFDLPGFVASELKRAGVEKIEVAGSSTYASSARYFSHRHTTKNGTPAGRQISIIAIE